MKRFMAALLGFLFLCTIFYALPAAAEESTERQLTMEEAMDYANKEIGYDYYFSPAQIEINGQAKTMELDRGIWDKHKILVYGGPEPVPDSEQDTDSTKKETDKGYYRYLGYTKNGDLMPDPDFREDNPSTTLINNYSWVVAPWERGLATDNNGFDGLECLKELRERHGFSIRQLERLTGIKRGIIQRV